MLKRLHEVEDKIEHENMLNPDQRLDRAELALHNCINEIERIREINCTCASRFPGVDDPCPRHRTRVQP